MIFDHRTYTCKPGMLADHLALYERMGRAPQEKHLGKPVLYATTEVGDVNTFVHIWSYQDLADRTARRAALYADHEWQAYMKAAKELGALVVQRNEILTPTPWFKLLP